MTVKLDDLLVLGILSAAIHWLIGRSEIAKPLWSRATGFWSRLLSCPACSGWWIGLGLGAAGLRPWLTGWVVLDIVDSAVMAMWLTPVFEAILLWGLDGSRIEN